MSRKFLSAAGVLCFCVPSIFAQGLQTSATKDDWEEVNFEFNSSILSDGYPSLLRLADLLKQHPDYKLQVEGHTDFVGSLPYNEKLALARASTVRDFLVKYGASASRIATSGQGKRSPEVANTTKEGRFINRRVVVTLRDGSDKVIGAGGVGEVVNSLDDRLKKLEDCCSAILKKLDKLDEILAAVRDLKNENDRLKSDIAGLKNQRPVAMPAAPAAPQMTPQQTGEIARSEVTKALEEQSAKNKKFSLLGVNVGPRTSGDLTFSGKGRYFAPFAATHAVQAEAEYMYSGGTSEKRQEGQFDLGLVNRFGNVQAGLFSSFKYVNMSAFQSGGTLGQGAFTLDYIFKRGRVGVFGTKGFRDNVTVGRTQLGPASFTETYLRIVDQVGGSTQVGLFGDSYIEGNLGYLKRHGGGDDRPGGMIRFVQPVSRQIAVTVEAGLNESLLAAKDSGRVVFGLQFGNWVRPKEFRDVTHPVPVDIPRIRYELLTRRIGNSAPSCDAGPDQIGVAPGTIRLDGSGSYDPDGDPITYEWTQIAGPSVGLTGRNEKIATFTAAEAQTYGFRLLVKDSGGLQCTGRVTVTSQRNVQARILRFLAQPNTIRQGQSSTLIWQVEGADTVDITSLGRVALSGTSVVSPRETTMYRLTARNATSEVNETVTVTVERQDARIILFQAAPATVMPGEASMLSWQTENADRVEISGLGVVSPNGRSSVTPTQTTTYTITARGVSGNEVTATATVQVVAGRMPRIIRFVASPPEILPGEQSTLTWQVENATTITITGIGTVNPDGTSSVSPTANTTYTITAKNAAGEVSATAAVTVLPGVKILDFTGTPTVITAGDTVTLKWSTVNATDVVITGVGSVPVNGTTTVKPTADTSYTLIAYGKRSQASAFLLIKVNPKVVNPNNRPPVANAGPDQTFYRNTATLDGTRSYDPDGDPITYSWRLVSFTLDPASKLAGPQTASISGATTATPSVVLPQWGTYIYELTVTDDKGASSTAVTRLTFVDP